MPLSNCSVSDVLVEATPLLDETLFQVVDVANPATVDALLEHASHIVVHGFSSGLLGGHSNGDRPKADCRHTLTYGGLQQVFFLKHMVGASKKVRCCIWVPCRSTPNFAPNPQNLGNYDKSSNNMK